MGQLQKKVADRKKLSLKDKIAKSKAELMEIKANRAKINKLLDEFNTYVNFMEKREAYLNDFNKKAIKKQALEVGDEVTMEVKEIENEGTENEEFDDFNFDETETEGTPAGDGFEENTEAKDVVKKEMARLKTQLANLERKLK